MSSDDKAAAKVASMPPLRRDLMRKIQVLSESLSTCTVEELLMADSIDHPDPKRLREVYAAELECYAAVAQAVPLWRARHAEVASKRKEYGTQLKVSFNGMDYGVSHEQCVLLNAEHRKLLRKERDAFAILDYLMALQGICSKRIEACSHSLSLRGQEMREKWLTHK